jgi:hypothetical protein
METRKTELSKYYRFQVFLATKQDENIKRTKNVGMAYLSEGQNIYSLRLWTFSWERFFVLPDKNNPSKYLIMTREASKSPDSKNKYYWNIVGNAFADSKNGVIHLNFDLIATPIYMNILPENSANSKNVPGPDIITDAA